MTVYVDDSGIQATVRDASSGRHYNARWSHLFCDGDLDELHTFALTIGMQRRWFQDWPEHRYPHYDLVSSRRERALNAGATPITTRDAVKVLADAFPAVQYRQLKEAAS